MGCEQIVESKMRHRCDKTKENGNRILRNTESSRKCKARGVTTATNTVADGYDEVRYSSEVADCKESLGLSTHS